MPERIQEVLLFDQFHCAQEHEVRAVGIAQQGKVGVMIDVKAPALAIPHGVACGIVETAIADTDIAGGEGIRYSCHDMIPLLRGYVAEVVGVSCQGLPSTTFLLHHYYDIPHIASQCFTAFLL